MLSENIRLITGAPCCMLARSYLFINNIQRMSALIFGALVKVSDFLHCAKFKRSTAFA
jgi:hypothetical protein